MGKIIRQCLELEFDLLMQRREQPLTRANCLPTAFSLSGCVGVATAQLPASDGTCRKVGLSNVNVATPVDPSRARVRDTSGTYDGTLIAFLF